MTAPGRREPPPDPEDFRIGSQRGNQYTPMGEVAMVGDLVGGLARGSGWRRPGWRRNIAVAGLVLIALFLVVLVLAVVDPAGNNA